MQLENLTSVTANDKIWVQPNYCKKLNLNILLSFSLISIIYSRCRTQYCTFIIFLFLTIDWFINSCYLLFILKAFPRNPRRWILYPFLKACSSIKCCNNNKKGQNALSKVQKNEANYRLLAFCWLNNDLRKNPNSLEHNIVIVLF